MSLEKLLETTNDWFRTATPFPFMVVYDEYSKPYEDAETGTQKYNFKKPCQNMAEILPLNLAWNNNNIWNTVKQQNCKLIIYQIFKSLNSS